MAKFKKNKTTQKSENNNTSTLIPESSQKDSVFVEENTNQTVLEEIENTFEEGSYKEVPNATIEQDNDEGANAQVFTEDKKKLKKKHKNNYEKTTFKHKMKVLGVLTVLGIFSGSGLGVWYFNSQLLSTFNPFDFKAEDYIQSINDTFAASGIDAKESDGSGWVVKAQSKGLTPADLTPANNFLLASFNTSCASSYIIDGVGYVNATALGVPAKQSIISRKKYNGSYYTFESISPSSFKGLGLPDIVLCDKYVGGDTLSLYTSKDLKPTKEDWKLSENIDKESYLLLSGSLPKEITPYIISEKTVSKESNTKENITHNEEDGTYTFTMSLDKQTSVINYSKQVKRTGGLNGYPEFEYINFTATIDDEWNLLSFSIQEKYYALKMGTRANCSGELNYTVTINSDVEMPV